MKWIFRQFTSVRRVQRVAEFRDNAGRRNFPKPSGQAAPDFAIGPI